MDRTVQVDFVGMCVLIEGPDTSSIGFLEESTHLHLIVFRQPDGQGQTPVSTLKILQPGRYTFVGCPQGNPAVIDHERLPDLNELAGASKEREEFNAAFRSQLLLPGGRFETRPPANTIANRPWRFGCDSQQSNDKALTDRSFLTTTTPGDSVTLRCLDGGADVVTLSADEDGIIRATILAIDHDLQGRPDNLDNGYALGEFQLLYACTQSFGPIPVFNAVLANPDKATCPQGRVQAGQ